MDINISEAEWEVMRVVWSNKETTSKFVIDTLGEEKSWTPSTIKTLLSRLVEKGFLETRKQGNKFLYSAKCVEDECLEILTQNFLERICERRTHIIVKNIIEKDNLSKSNIDEIIDNGIGLTATRCPQDGYCTEGIDDVYPAPVPFLVIIESGRQIDRVLVFQKPCLLHKGFVLLIEDILHQVVLQEAAHIESRHQQTYIPYGYRKGVESCIGFNG